MSNTALSHTATITSRICHDLANPMGAISNGIELLELTGLPDTPEFALIQDSIAHAKAKISFFRLAYSTHSTGEMSGAELTALLQALYTEARLSVSLTAPLQVKKSHAQLGVLLVKCCETALVRGGTIALDIDEDKTSLLAKGDQIKQSNVWGQLDIPNLDDVTSTDSHFAIAGLCLQTLGKLANVVATEQTLTINVAP